MNHSPLLSESGDAEIAQYHPLSKMAVAALALGLFSPLAVLEPVLFLIPLVGIVAGVAALMLIARNTPALLGRKVALAGLILSVGFGTAAPAHWLTYRELLRREARQFAMAWFDFLREDQPQKAFQLTRHPNYRQPLDDSLWDYYRSHEHVRRELEKYVAPKGRYDTGPRLVRTLLALGPKAQVRYFSTDGQMRLGGVDVVHQTYVVTYDDAGQRKTFFVGLELKRFLIQPDMHASWQLATAKGGVRPAVFGPDPKKNGAPSG